MTRNKFKKARRILRNAKEASAAHPGTKPSKSPKNAELIAKILNHTDVLWVKGSSGSCIIKVKEQYWRITSERAIKLTASLADTDDVFFLNLKQFYTRFVLRAFEPEENAGKKWTEEEDAILRDMMDDDYTIGDIASQLKRDIGAICIRGSKYANIDSKTILVDARSVIHGARFSEYS